MRRRTLLASLAAGTSLFAGCSLTSGATSDPQTDTLTAAPDPSDRTTDEPTTDRPTDAPGTDKPTATPDDSPWPESMASVVELETVPRTYAFGPTGMYTDDGAEVALSFERTATADHPATLRGVLRNGNDYENTFEIQWIPAVGRVHARQPDGYDHEAALHLAPTEANELAETVPSLAQTAEGHWYAEDIGPWVPERVRLDPGEERELAYAVVGEPNLPGRPTGTYEMRGDDETASITVWDSTSPGPEAESRFAGRSVPVPSPGPTDDDTGDDPTIQWYHAADRTTPAFVRPSTERLELDGRVTFTMVNNSREGVGCGHWNLYKLVDGRWFHVGPLVHTSDCRLLAPGARKEWSLRAFNGEAVPCHGHHLGLTRGYLGGGLYGVVAGYGHPADRSGALVELVGDPAEVVPIDGVTTEREGTVVTVTTDRYGDDDEYSEDASFALERADSADRRLLAEQIMGSDGFGGAGGLRNALPFLRDDVERVVVRTDDQTVDGVVGYDSSTARFRFRGQAYVATRQGSEE